MAVFFLFFTVQYGVIGLLEEQRDGTLARLLAAPIRRTSVITAKALLSYWLGIISLGVLIVATHFLMGAIWGPPLGVILLVLAGVFSAVAIMGLVGSLAKTPEGAGNLAAIVAVILGMLGGTFFQVGQGDDLLSKLTYLTPHAWFLRGLASISGGAEWTAALPSVAALLIFGVVTGSIAWVALRRRITV
jgi:ABC-2 type transport system permease protein